MTRIDNVSIMHYAVSNAISPLRPSGSVATEHFTAFAKDWFMAALDLVTKVATDPAVEKTAAELGSALAAKLSQSGFSNFTEVLTDRATNSAAVKDIVDFMHAYEDSRRLSGASMSEGKSVFQTATLSKEPFDTKMDFGGTTMDLHLPSAFEVQHGPLTDVAAKVLENHQQLLEVTAKRWVDIPFLGFHGTDAEGAKFIETNMISRGRDGFFTAATIRKSRDPEELLADLYRASTESDKYAVDNWDGRNALGKTFALDMSHESRPLYANGGLASELRLDNIYKNERWLHDDMYQPLPTLYGSVSKNVGEMTTTFNPTNFAARVRGSILNSDWIDYRSSALSIGLREPLAKQTARQIVVAKTYEILGLIKRH